MNDDPTPTLTSIGRCFVGALHGPSDKANEKVSVVNWNSGIGMAPSSKYCSAQRYGPATDTPRNTSVAHRHWVRLGSNHDNASATAMSAPTSSGHVPHGMSSASCREGRLME